MNFGGDFISCNRIRLEVSVVPQGHGRTWKLIMIDSQATLMLGYCYPLLNYARADEGAV